MFMFTFSQVILPTNKNQKLFLSRKMHNVLIGVFVFLSSFVRFLIFELWPILDSTQQWLTKVHWHSEKSGRVFCEPDSDAN